MTHSTSEGAPRGAWPRLAALVRDLREAARQGPERVGSVLEDSAAAMASDPAEARAWQAELGQLLHRTDATHLLTDTGILTDEGLIEGIARRVGGRLAPAPPRRPDLDHELGRLVTGADEAWLRALDTEVVARWVQALVGSGAPDWDEASEIASATLILATRVAGGGLDPRLAERLPELEDWNSPFLALARVVDHYAEQLVEGSVRPDTCRATVAVVDRCAAQIEAFRERKKTLGTNLDLSSRSLRMQQQLRRLRLLLAITHGPPDQRRDAAARLVLAVLRAEARGRRVGDFVREKVDLLAYLAVGHAAKQGSKYVVRETSKYWGFLWRSTGGGLLVALFATLKIHLSHEAFAPLLQAFVYGLNYAVCFALIYLLGATLATKQPAMTASRLARALEEGGPTEDFALLVRAIWRSQFISFVGNILGAAAFTALLAGLLGDLLVTEYDARKLLAELHPLQSASVWYAAVAGVLLSLAGFLASWVDNAVVFHRVRERIEAGGGVFALIPAGLRSRLAERVDHGTGALSGNVALGFLLGSAGTVGLITGLPLDIRHIAFASSHATLGLLALPAAWTVGHVALMLVAVLLIGLINFLVSFGMTLVVAIESRKVKGVDWRDALRDLWRLALREPVRFFLPLPDGLSRSAR